MLLLFASNAEAQTYYCSRPSEPYIRSGYSADYDQMERTRREVEQYLDEMNEYRNCLANEHEDAEDEAEQVISDWETAVRRFNGQ